MGCAVAPHRLPSADSVVNSVTRPFLFQPKRMQLSGSGSKATGLLCYRHKIISRTELTTSKQRQRQEGRERWKERGREKGGRRKGKGKRDSYGGGKGDLAEVSRGSTNPFFCTLAEAESTHCLCVSVMP